MEVNYTLTEKLSIKNMRQLTKSLIEEEAKKDKIDVHLSPLTIVEWYKSDIFKKQIKLQEWTYKFDAITEPIFNFGIAYDNKKIILFLNTCKIYKIINPNHAIIDLITTSYHELAHLYQRQYFANYSKLQMLSIILSDYINNYEYTYYDIHHDSYFEELDANLYAINKTEAFLRKYPHLYQKHQDYLTTLKERYKYEYSNYSFNTFFNKFHQIYKENPKEYKLYHGLTNVFYQADTACFKTITDIINHEDFDFYKEEIFNAIITSNSYLNELDYNTLTNEEINILKNELNIAITIELEKQKRTITYQQKNKNKFYQINLLYNLSKTTKRIKFLKTHLNILETKTISKKKN